MLDHAPRDPFHLDLLGPSVQRNHFCLRGRPQSHWHRRRTNHPLLNILRDPARLR